MPITGTHSELQNSRLSIDTLMLAGTDVTASAAQLNAVANPSGRIVVTTATALNLTATEHGSRVVVINTNSTVANTFSLPVATGSGVQFNLINNLTQTQGTIVVAANGTDVIQGRCIAFDSTAVATAANSFVTTATSDKISFNRTTTGGLGGDQVVAWDIAANTWLVRVETRTSGVKATPFSET